MKENTMCLGLFREVRDQFVFMVLQLVVELPLEERGRVLI